MDDCGKTHKIVTTAYYVPEARVRLFSTYPYFKRLENQGGDGEFKVNEHGSHFRWPFSDATRTFEMSQSNLPMAYPKKPGNNKAFHASLVNTNSSVLEEVNTHLDDSQKQLLLLHQRLGHFSMHWIQNLMRAKSDEKPIITPKLSQSATCQVPKCASCLAAKMKRRPIGAQKKQNRKDREGALSAGDLKPGDAVSVDQFESTVRGRLLNNSYGKERTSSMYSGGTIFVDHASSFVFVQMQVGLTGHETVRAKHKFESLARSNGIRIAKYHGDNGIFKDAEWKSHLEKHYQTMDYSGVGAHHANGKAERAIQTIMNAARAMLLHACVHWPQETDINLWPFAVQYAAYIWNHLPDPKNDLSPEEIFYSSRRNTAVDPLSEARVFGCPVYVLDPKLQDGKKLPKWEPRCRRGQYLGFSSSHARNVALVRNTRTGFVSPQFHVVFDELYQTILSSDSNVPDEWEQLFQNCRHLYLDEDVHPDDYPELSPDWFTPTEGANPPQVAHPPHQWLTRSMTRSSALTSVREGGMACPTSVQAVFQAINEEVRDNYWTNLSADEAYLSTLPFLMEPRSHFERFMATYQEDLYDDDLGCYHTMHPMAFGAKAKSADLPSLREALASPYRDDWIKAMKLEVQTLEDKNVWDVVERPQGKQVLESIWVLRLKRYPDGTAKKFKGRFTVRGDQQVGLESDDVYAPVVGWATVRLVLILSVQLGWKSKQVDYDAAFVQAKLDTEVYCEMPPMFREEGYVLKLKRSLYGLRESPKNWVLTLREALKDQGLIHSKNDPCLLMSDKVICIAYVDDCIFFEREPGQIDKVVKALQDENNPNRLDLHVEEDAAGFLGIELKKHTEGDLQGCIELLQTGLIDKVIRATGLQDASTKDRPATAMLGKDETGDAPCEKWSYSSIVGMLMYLASNSRPDIAFATHACARFSHNPKRSHEQAVKNIVKYLKGTKDRGMVIHTLDKNKHKKLRLDCWVDADFAGGFGVEDPRDPICAKSRTGYVLTLCDTPVMWVSKLQSKTALSTMEAECVALAQSMRDLLPVRRLLQEISSAWTGLPIDPNSTVHEDNSACEKFANSGEIPKITPRNKHFAVDVYWFLECIGPDKGITVERVDTKLQRADPYTKPLETQDFIFKRKLLMGW